MTDKQGNSLDIPQGVTLSSLDERLARLEAKIDKLQASMDKKNTKPRAFNREFQ